MELGLRGRTAIVCGASSGMGLAIAEALVAEGANVAMFARRRDLLEREADRLGALAVRGDLTNPAHLGDPRRDRRSRPSAGSTCSSSTAAARRGRPQSTSRPSRSRRPSSSSSPRRYGSSPSATTTSGRERARPDRRDHVELGPRADPEPRALERRAARADRLAEDARARARPGRRDGQRDRARPHRDRPAAGGLRRRRPERRPTSRASRCAGSASRGRSARSSAFLASDRAAYVTATVVPVDGGLTRGLL